MALAQLGLAIIVQKFKLSETSAKKRNEFVKEYFFDELLQQYIYLESIELISSLRYFMVKTLYI